MRRALVLLPLCGCLSPPEALHPGGSGDFPPAGLQVAAVLAHDLDGDGRDDLLVAGQATSARGVWVLTSRTAEGDRYDAFLDTGGPPSALAAADVTGAGLAEIFVLAVQEADGRNHLLAFADLAGPPLAKEVDDLVGVGALERPAFVGALDLDRDGAPEIFISDASSLWGQELPAWDARAFEDMVLVKVPGTWNTDGWYSAHGVAALPGGAVDDLLVIDEGEPTWYENPGGADFTTAVAHRADGESLYFAIPFDLDGDGAPEILGGGFQDLRVILPRESFAALPYDRPLSIPDNNMDGLAALLIDDADDRPDAVVLDRGESGPSKVVVLHDLHRPAGETRVTTNELPIDAPLPDGFDPIRVVGGDLDGDGRDEWLVIDAGGQTHCAGLTPAGALRACGE
jgi:hypothetical protein